MINKQITHQQELLREILTGNQINIAVLHLTGVTGSGKTMMIQKLSSDFPGLIQILSPEGYGKLFNESTVDWVNHSAVAIDETTLWDRASIVKGIASLESFAKQFGKKLILISQEQRDLKRIGVILQLPPLLINICNDSQSIKLSNNEQQITFT
jgi:type II secretory pathway predicted ATPase ExeA